MASIEVAAPALSVPDADQYDVIDDEGDLPPPGTQAQFESGAEQGRRRNIPLQLLSAAKETDADDPRPSQNRTQKRNRIK